MNKSLLSWLIVVIALFAGAVVYPDMPEQMPIHWNANNEIDNYAHKALAIFLLPGLMTLFAIIFQIIPIIDYKKQNYSKFKPSLHIVQNVVLLGLLVLHGVMIAYGYGVEIKISTIVLPMIGIIFVAVGNYMPRFQPNSFVGIKTIYTLNNETVWRKTNRAAAKFYAIGGLLVIGTAFIPSPLQTILFISIVVIISFSTLFLSLYYGKQAK